MVTLAAPEEGKASGVITEVGRPAFGWCASGGCALHRHLELLTGRNFWPGLSMRPDGIRPAAAGNGASWCQ